MVTGFAQGITAAQAFVRIGVEDKVSAALAVVQGKIRQFAANIGGIAAELQKIALGGGIFGSGILYGLKRATEESSRATEVNTAYAATFRELTAEASKFADTLSTRFKRDVVDVKDIQRSFFGLFTGQGFDRGFSLQVADVFTHLAFDFSSFFNQTVEEASGRLLSALSNSAEVVQRFGFNVRVVNLEKAFKDLGIEKSVEQASEAEKLVARVLVLLQTSSAAQLNIFGDVDRTINEFANQTRGLQSAVTIFLRAIGKPFEQALAPIIGGLAKATQAAAAWISHNPKFVTQIGLLTAALVAGATTLITFGFGLRLAAFSLGPFVKLLSAPILVMAKLFDVVGFTTTSFIAFARVGIAGVVVSVQTLLPVLGTLTTGMRLVFAATMLTAPVFPFFARAVSSMAAGSVRVITGMAGAFMTSFRLVNAATYASIMTFFGLAKAVRSAPAAAANSLILLSNSAKTAGLALTTSIMLPARIASGTMYALSKATSALSTSFAVAQNVAMNFGTILRTLGAASVLIGVQLLKGLGGSLGFLRGGLQSTAAGFVGMARTAVVSLLSVSAAMVQTVAVGLAPILAKLALLATVGAAIGSIFYLFKDQISGALSSLASSIGDFASNAVSSVGGFITTLKSVFFDVLDFGKEQFWSLLAIGKATFTGLNNAIRAGDFKLAFQIAMAGAKEAFFSFSFDAVSRWEDALTGFLSGLIKLKVWFKTIFTEITGFVQLAFEKMQSARQDAVNSISQGIVAGLVKIGAVDAEVAQTLQEDIARQEKSKEDAIKAETDRRVADLENEKQAALGGVDAGVKAFKDNLGKALDSARTDSRKLNEEAAAAAASAGVGGGKLGDLVDVEGFLSQIKSQATSGTAGMADSVRQSLEGMDVRSSKGFQFFADALNNRNPNKGVEDRLASIEAKLVSQVPQAMGQAVGDALESREGIVGLPNQARN